MNGGKGNMPDTPMVQVRELLFGAQLKDMEMRFRRQEERLLREISEVKDSLRSRLDSLENFMKSEVTSLLGKIKEERDERDAVLRTETRERQEEIKNEAKERSESVAAERRETQENFAKEQRERTEGDAKLNSDLAATNENFERRSSKLSASIEALERTLRELIMKESSELNDKIDEKYNEAINVIDKTSSQIRADMVHRTALSTMFTETVSSLSKPWNIDVSPTESSVLYEAEGGETGHDSGQNDNPGDQGNNQY
ncbi:MAG: hypothetical protein LBV23_03695 [Deltaproteobacteria bacterium]|jgi:chromosome segregation ATPase|nr:hypothetical protein [Deltaproteobacteria bacterium]